MLVWNFLWCNFCPFPLSLLLHATKAYTHSHQPDFCTLDIYKRFWGPFLAFSRLKSFRSLRVEMLQNLNHLFFCSLLPFEEDPFWRRSLSLELRSPELGPDTWDKWHSSFAQKFYYCLHAVLRHYQWSQAVSLILAPCTTAYLESPWVGMLYNRNTISDPSLAPSIRQHRIFCEPSELYGADPKQVNAVWKPYLTSCFLISAKLQ